MLENLIFFFLSSEISKNFQEKPENSFFELKISSIEKKISQEDEKNDKKISWKAWLVFDLNSSSVLWEKNQNEKLPMASLTKLMTTLLILESDDLDSFVKLDKESVYYWWAWIDIKVWEYFKVRDLLKGALIRSWNNAVIALAKHDSWSVEKFVEKMNKRAEELWLKNTKFQNPTWFDDNWHYSTVKDLAILSKYVYKYDFVKNTVSQKKWTIWSKFWRKVSFFTTNRLLSDEIVWLKTWTTPDAWQCLITIIKKDWKELLFVLLWSENRFPETKDLINFVFEKI